MNVNCNAFTQHTFAQPTSLRLLPLPWHTQKVPLPDLQQTPVDGSCLDCTGPAGMMSLILAEQKDCSEAASERHYLEPSLPVASLGLERES